MFRGRIAEDFKLITGTFVRVGAVPTALLSAVPVLADVVVRRCLPSRRGAAGLVGHVTAPVSARAVLGAYLVLPPVWWALMIGSGSMLSMMARMSSGLSHSQSCSR